jgi:hypothetical protein
MENFIKEGSSLIPSINFDYKSGEFTIKGRMISVAGEGYEYFKPLLDWVDRYTLNPAKQTIVDVDLEYCSSGSIMILYQIFKILDGLYKNGHDVSVFWHYFTEDEDNEEKGIQFQDLVQLPFHVIARTNDY